MSALLTLQDSFLPSRPLRVCASVLCGVLTGLCASPLSTIALTSGFVVLIILGWIMMTRWGHRRGLRTNSYAPMTPDAAVSTPQHRDPDDNPGGNSIDGIGGITDPSYPRQAVPPHVGTGSTELRAAESTSAAVPWPPVWFSTWSAAAAGVGLYAVLTIGTTIADPVLGWGWAALVAIITTGTLLNWAVRSDQAPTGHVPLRCLVHPGTPLPHSDADQVAAVLYAVLAVPEGRQITYEGLTRAIQSPEMNYGMDRASLDRALAELCVRGVIAVVTERDRTGQRIRWITLTKGGARYVVELLQQITTAQRITRQ